MRRWYLAGLLALLAGRADADPPAVRIVAAADAALASMALLTSQADDPVLLYDPRGAEALQHTAGPPRRCLVRAAAPAEQRAAVQAAAGSPCLEVSDLSHLAHQLWPAPPAVVVTPADDYVWLLRGAALAGALGGALLPFEPSLPPPDEALAEWKAATWYLLAGAAPRLPDGVAVHRLRDADEVMNATVQGLGAGVRTVVVANAADRSGRFSATSLSLLAPLIAATHRAPLVLVSSAAATAVETEVRRAIALAGLAPSHIYLVGDEWALRSHRVSDPVFAAGGPESLDGAREVRVELFAQIQNLEPQAYAVGRFVGEDPTRASLTLARQRQPAAGGGGPVVFLSNADGVFGLGETISRTTASELRNANLPVRDLYRAAVTPAAIEEALRSADVLVWEGHVRDLTLAAEGGTTVDRTPPFVVLQGCSTLDRSDPFILLEHGTQALIATSAAIHSASGSAFARALFDSLVYDRDDLGTAVRDARNYLFALTELKRRRGYRDWTKTYRAALAFALWGDPTSLPPFAAASPKRPPITWEVDDAQALLSVPPRRLKPVRVGRYLAQPLPRAMFGGLLLRDGDGAERTLKELFFGAFAAPLGVTAACPPAPGWEVVSLYAPATHTLSVLARPPGERAGESAAAQTYALPLVPAARACP